jgi:uncharacterized membrane protein
LLDDRGVRHLDPLAYLALQNLVPALVFAALLARRGGPALRAAWACDRRSIVVVGAGSALSYLCALHAFRLGPVGPAAALRELSVVLGVLLGVLVLGERATPRRLAAVASILAGAVLLRLS